VAATVVANRRANVIGHRADVTQEVFDALGLKLGIFLERRVQIGHVCLVMLSVMNLHRLGVDVRFERIEGVR
jgi:hypothetical protein